MSWLSHFRKARSVTRQTRKRHQPRPLFDLLEDRLAPTVSASFESGALTIEMTEQDDTAIVSLLNDNTVAVNGVQVLDTGSLPITVAQLTSGISVSDTGTNTGQTLTFDNSAGSSIDMSGAGVGGLTVAGIEIVNVANGYVKLTPGATPPIGTTSSVNANTAVSITPSSTDLLQGLSPTANTNPSGGLEGTSAAANVLTNGIAPSTIGRDTNNYTIGNGAQITYQLDTGASPVGYDLTGINIYSRWQDTGRDNIFLAGVSYSTVDAPTTFVTLSNTAVNYNPTTGIGSVKFSSAGGIMATRVSRVRFDFGNPQENNHVGYTELDVIGVNTAAGANFPGTALVVGAAGTFDLNGNFAVFGSLAGSAGAIITNGSTSGATLNAGSNNVDTVFHGVLQNGAGNLALSKAGSGKLTLTGANTYTGATVISAGTLQLGDGVVALTTLGASAITNNAALVIDQIVSQTVSSSLAISGTGTVTFSGAGTVALSGARSYTGATTINAGSTVNTSNATALGVSDVIVNGTLNVNASLSAGSLAGANTGSVVLADGSVLTVGGKNTASTTFGGVISGGNASSGLTKTGTGIQILSNANTYVGPTNVNNGTLRLGIDAALPSTTNVVVSGTGTLDVQTFASNVNGVQLLAGTISGTGTGALTSATAYDVQNGAISAILGGTVDLNKTTANTVTLSGINSYTGITTISGGVLATNNLANGSAASGIGQSDSTAANLVLNGGTLRYTGAAVNSDRLFTITASGGTLDASGSGALNLNGAGAIAFTGSGARTFTLTGTSTGANALLPILGDGTGGVTTVSKTAAGTWNLTGANTFTGTVTVNAGVLVAGAVGDATGGLGAGSAAINVLSGGTLGLSGVDVSGKNITIDGTGAAGQPGALVAVANSGNSSYTGTLAARLVNLGSIGIGAGASSQLTLDGTVDLRASRVTFDGAGNIAVNSPIIGLGASQVVSGVLEGRFYPGTVLQSIVDIGNGTPTGGLLGMTATSSVGYTGDLNFNNNFGAGFPELGASFTANTFSTMWTGEFVPNAVGNWTFNISNVDDNGRIYLDLNDDGVFNNTNELLVNGNATSANVVVVASNPGPGQLLLGQAYTIALAHFENTGNEAVTFRYTPPSGSVTTINPSAQSSIFQGRIFGNNALTKNGAGVLTLGSTNTYTGNTTINAGTVTTTADNALGSNAASILTVTGTSVLNLRDAANAVTTVGMADFSGITGAGKVDTKAGALTVNSVMRLSGGVTASQTGGSSFTVAGPNISAADSALNSGTARTITASGGTLLLTTASGSPLAGVLTNPSFESNTGTANSFAAQALIGWTNGSGVEQGTSATFSPVAGNTGLPNYNATTNFKWAYIQGAQTMSQTFTVASAGSYTIGFAAAGRSSFRGPLNVKVQIDGVDTSQIFIPSNTAWNTYRSDPITLSAGNHTLSFVFLNALGGDRSSVLDAVTITKSTSNSLANTNVVLANSATLNLGDSTVSHTIGSVTVPGGAALTLSNAASVTVGGIAASGSGSAAISGTPTVQIASGQNVDVSMGVNLTINSVIADPSALTKTGPGTLTLAGANTYTGATAVNAGMLTVNGSLANTAVTVSNAGSQFNLGPAAAIGGSVNANADTIVTSGLTGTITGGLSAASADITVGGDGPVGILTVGGALTADATSVFNVDFQNAGSFDIINAGSLSLSGTATIKLNKSTLPSSAFAAGTNYALITYTTPNGGSPAFVLDTSSLSPADLNTFTFSLLTEANAVRLVIGTQSPNLVWDNNSGNSGTIDDGAGSWVNGSTNFLNLNDLGAGQYSFNNSQDFDVAFGNPNVSGTGGVVTIDEPTGIRVGGQLTFNPASTPYTLAPTALNGGPFTLTTRAGISANNDATISAPLRLEATQPWLVAAGKMLTIEGVVDESSAAGIIKVGAGVLLLAGPANGMTYTGSTTINAGSIQLAADNQLPATSAVTLANIANAVLDLHGFDQTIDSLGGGGSLGGNVILSNGSTGGTLTVGNTTSTFDGVISGLNGGLTKQGGGTLTLTRPNTYTGPTAVNGGILVAAVANTFAIGNVIDIGNGGTLTASAANALSGTVITIHAGGTLNPTVPGALNGATIYIEAGATFNPTIVDTLTGVTIHIDGGTLNASVAGALNGAIINFNSGTLTPGIIDALTGTTIAINTGATLSPTVTDSLRGSALTIAGGTLDVDATSTAVASLTLQSGNVHGTTGVITSVAPYVVQSGSITAKLGGTNVALNKTTSGTVTLAGAHTYTGATNIDDGILTLDGSTAAGSTVNVNANGTLAGSGVASGNATLAANGTINFTGAISGTLTITGGTWSGAGTVTGQVTSASGAFTLANGAVLTATTGVAVSGGTVALDGSIVGALVVTGTPTITVGVGASVTIANFSAGTGTVDATNPLTITSTLRLSGDVTGSGTLITAQGSNIVNDIQTGAQARTLTIAGGTFTLAGESAPANLNQYGYRIVTGANSGISSANTYTHAIDFSGTTTGAAVSTIDGVAFNNYFGASMPGSAGGSGATAGNDSFFNSAIPVGTYPALYNLFNDFRYDATTNNVVLTGLTPGKYYETRLYMRTWANVNDDRRQQFDAFIGNSVTPQSTWVVNEDNPLMGSNTAAWNTLVTNNGGWSSGTAWAMSYVFQADAAGKFTLRATALVAANTLHLYGLTNQEVTPPPGLVALPNTNIVVTGSATFNMAAASANNVLGSLTLPNAATTLTVGAAADITFNGIISAGAGNQISGSTELGLTSGSSIDVTGDLTIGNVIGDTAAATALAKIGAGTLVLTGANTYSGATAVTAGALLVNGSLGSPGGAVTVDNAGSVLGGTGEIDRPVTINAGASLAPGASVGTLGVNNDLTLGGISSFEVTGGSGPLGASDLVNGIGVLTYGGTLKVTNVGAAFALNDSWDLFHDFTSHSGSFSNTFPSAGDGSNLPLLTGGLAWSFDYNSGVLSVISAVVAPTVLSINPVIGPTTGGTLVTILGANFAGTTSVTFDGFDAATFTVVSGTQIDAVTSAHVGVGAVEVVVTNSAGSDSLAGTDDFTFAPSVSSVVVNGGPGVVFGASTFSLAGQHSVVKQILVTFHEAVTVASDAFTVTRRTQNVTVNGGASPSAVAVVANSVTMLSASEYLVTFNGTGTHVGGVIDSGVYDLTTLASKVTVGAQTMAADQTTTFFAMFGNIEANNRYNGAPITQPIPQAGYSSGNGLTKAFVDPGSLFQFSDTFGSTATNAVGPPAYNIVFDYNLDGAIDPGDLFAFSDSFGIDWNF